jgi:phage-related tail protein
LFSAIVSFAIQRQQGGSFASLLNLIPHFAGGTNFAPGGLSLVGENGPEVVNLARGSQVIPNSALSALANLKAPSAGGTVIDYRVTIDLAGANGDETIRKIAYQAAAQGGAAAYAAAVRDVPRNMARRARRAL